jgi:D-2-hydroxyacid dehydrogenase (NADP+)
MMRPAFLLATLSLGVLVAQSPTPKKIVVTGMAVPWMAEMKQAAPNVTFVEGRPESLTAEIADADAILGTINPQLFSAAKKLKWVHIYSAGVERHRFPEFINSNVTLTNGRIIQGPEIADHALALLLTLTRGLNRAIADRTKEEWGKGQWKAIELRGKTAVVIGVGGIGSQIATRAHAFGMNVIGVDIRDIPFHPAISQMVRADRLDSVLPKADVVFTSVPHTPESEGMMGARQFELMKPDSYFIAVSRGKIYSTPALVKALDSKRLAGAGLDVTDPEPLPKGHALWKFDNVVITPHIATVSDMVGGRYRELVFDNVARFAKDEPLRNVVDKIKGF